MQDGEKGERRDQTARELTVKIINLLLWLMV